MPSSPSPRSACRGGTGLSGSARGTRSGGGSTGGPAAASGPGQDADITHADGLLDGFAPAVAITGKGYDNQALVDAIGAKGGEAVIPAGRNRAVSREIDAERY